MSRRWDTALEFLRPGRDDLVAIPPMDGPLMANDLLESCEVMYSTQPGALDDLVLQDGAAFVGDGDQIVRLDGDDLEKVSQIATLPGPVGAMAVTPDGSLLACVTGKGLFRIGRGGEVSAVLEASGEGSLACLTGVTVHSDGSYYLTSGSRRRATADWVWDLMERGRTGQLLRHDPGSGGVEVLLDGLAYANGVTVAADDTSLLFAESWRHTMGRFDLQSGKRSGDVLERLPGYPGRISTSPAGGYWLAVFALRTHLIEFLLGEDKFRQKMMATIDPDYWIRPTLRSLDSGLEPMQEGQTKKLGVMKPWAPPRSYGLAVRLDDDGDPVDSVHSRAGAVRHGITSVREAGLEVYLVSSGGGMVLRMKIGAAS
jgi:hypothetical protein